MFKNIFGSKQSKQKVVFQANLQVFYDKPLNEGAEKLGYFNPYVSSRYFKPPAHGQKQVHMEVVSFSESVNSNEAISRLGQMGLQRPSAQDLVALAHHKDLAIDKILGDYESKILGLCEPWSDPQATDGDAMIPILEGVARTRRVRLALFNYLWNTPYLFLGVHR